MSIVLKPTCLNSMWFTQIHKNGKILVLAGTDFHIVLDLEL